MKLRNKKTGEILDLIEIVRINGVSNEFYLRLSDNEGITFKVGFSSLAELEREWEDYEDRKEYWFVSEFGKVYSWKNIPMDKERIGWLKQIGNYFETREEAEKAVEKLKAWKRVKDLGFKFRGNDVINDVLMIKYDFNDKEADLEACAKALHDVILLFGDKNE